MIWFRSKHGYPDLPMTNKAFDDAGFFIVDTINPPIKQLDILTTSNFYYLVLLKGICVMPEMENMQELTGHSDIIK
jgi:hypothetical protein